MNKIYILNKLKKVSSKLQNKFINSKSYVFSCYSLKLIIILILRLIYKTDVKNKTIGTLRFNFSCKNNSPQIPMSSYEKFEYLSFSFIQKAHRYYKRIIKINKLDIFGIKNEVQVFYNIRYLISLIEISINQSKDNKFIFYSSSSGNKIVDLLFRKYYLKKYNIEIKICYLSKIIKPKDDLKFTYKKVSFDKSAFLYPIFKPLKYSDNNLSKIVFIHHEDNKENEPYNKLKNDVAKIKKFKSLNYLLIYQIGSKDFNKFIINTIYYSFNIIRRNFFQIISKRLYGEIFQTISNQIYYQCCINTINLYDLKIIISSYISYDLENILYKACDNLSIKSIFYDYSMGYPGLPNRKNFIGTTHLECYRNPSYIITFGEVRCEQYQLKKSNFLNRESIVFNTLCPQIEFSRNNQIIKNNSKFLYNSEFYKSSIPKISIFDNIYGYNFLLSKKDAISCIDTLNNSNLNHHILCHSKREGFLKNYLIKKNMIFECQARADFSNSYYCDYIISLGYQGAALKAAFAFDKPLIFFTENKRFFKDAKFFSEHNKNNNILNIIFKLTFNKEHLEKFLNSEKEYQKFILQIRKYSKLLLLELGLNSSLKTAKQKIFPLINQNIN